jgi:hypothetical protein
MGEATEYSMTGEAGTAIFADTSSCFHYGSRSEKPRMMAFFQYFAPTAFKLSSRSRKICRSVVWPAIAACRRCNDWRSMAAVKPQLKRCRVLDTG